MFGTHFYHSRIRKSVAVFGAMFNDIFILRKDSGNRVISTVKVPLSYAPKRKFLERLLENPDLDTDQKIAVKLPRMSFEIISITYDQTRQLTKITNFNQPGTTINNRTKFYSPTPYNIGFQLNIYAKTQDDALQIVEQIIPYFNPQYTLTIKPIDGFDTLKEDTPLVLNSVTFSDDYEGQLEARRTIIYTIDFEMKINFYGPINTGEIVRTSITTLGQRAVGLADSDIPLETIIVTTNPANASFDSDYGFTDDINLIFDE
jgi:hypothetical protein